jgi:translation initiation factor 6 (eIF-6)
MGVPFVGMGVVANSKGALVGHATSGFEVQRIYEALFGDEI